MKKTRWLSWMNPISSIKEKVGVTSSQCRKPYSSRWRRLRLEPLEQRQMLTTIMVDSLLSVVDDTDGKTTLQEAIAQANATINVADIIEFDQSVFGDEPHTIQLQGNALSITDDLEIKGLGADLLTIDANDLSRVFYVKGASVVFSGMTITGGYTGYGGGIFASGSTIEINNSNVTGNTSTIWGGGIQLCNADLTLSRSTISSNTSLYGGGINVRDGSTVTVDSSVLLGNVATALGGGIYTKGIYSDDNNEANDWIAAVTLVNATLTANEASKGGGIYENSGSEITASNTIISLNSANAGSEIYGTLEAASTNNLIGDDPLFVRNPSDGGDGWGNANDDYGDLRLIVLSPGIDAGDNTFINGTTDLNGNERIIYDAVDVGAYEYNGDIVVSTLSDDPAVHGDNDYTYGNLSLREALYLASQNPGDGTILFDPAMFTDGINDVPRTITLWGAQLDITSNVTFQGPGADLLTIDANDLSRVFYVKGASVVFSGMTITGGYTGYGGGIFASGSTIEINDSNVTGNTSTVWGGGIQLCNANLTLSRSTISSNTSLYGGGINVRDGSTVTVDSSVLLGNVATALGGGIYTKGIYSDDNNEANDWIAAVTLVNATLVANEASKGGGIYENSGSEITASNTILSLNSASVGSEIYGTLEAASTNNLIGDDPLFVRNPSDGGDGWGNANDDFGDLRLTVLSPGVNTGDNTLASGTTDLNGNERIVYNAVDVGAYEYRSTLFWDTNGATAGFGDGSGTWSTSDAYWTIDPTGASTTQVWDNSGECIAVFAGMSGGTVEIAGNARSQSLQFFGSDYLVEGSLELTESIHSIYVDANTEATVSAAITGSDGLLKNGDGTLILSGTLGLTGGLTADAGKVTLVTSTPYTDWTESGGKIMGPGALDFHDLGAGHLYSTVVSGFADDGTISRADMLSIFDVADGGYVTTNEFHDLNLIVDNPYLLQMDGYVSASNPGYVDVLAGYVVDGNVANANYQGAALGNLAENDLGTKLTTLVNKWFKGLDRPTTNYSYAEATGSLFVDGTSVDDMKQGAIGDCYLIATFGSIADADVDINQNGVADAIENMIIDNGDNTWTVRFYDDSFTANYVTVDNMLPTYSNLLVYANYGESLSGELWMPLLEKAYAQWNETGEAQRPTGMNGINSYESIAGGWMFITTDQVLGKYTSAYYVSGGQSILNSAIDAGYAVTIGTVSDFDPDSSYPWRDGLIEGHAYVVTGYDNGYYTLRNPWGSSDPGPLTWAQLENDCVFFTYADSSGTSSFNTSPVGGSAPSRYISPDIAAAVHATLSTSPAVTGKFGHDGFALQTTESSVAELATFQHHRIDAAFAADVPEQTTDEPLDNLDAIWSIGNDRLGQPPVACAVDMLFSDVTASNADKLLSELGIDLPVLG